MSFCSLFAVITEITDFDMKRVQYGLLRVSSNSQILNTQKRIPKVVPCGRLNPHGKAARSLLNIWWGRSKTLVLDMEEREIVIPESMWVSMIRDSLDLDEILVFPSLLIIIFWNESIIESNLSVTFSSQVKMTNISSMDLNTANKRISNTLSSDDSSCWFTSRTP